MSLLESFEQWNQKLQYSQSVWVSCSCVIVIQSSKQTFAIFFSYNNIYHFIFKCACVVFRVQKVRVGIQFQSRYQLYHIHSNVWSCTLYAKPHKTNCFGSSVSALFWHVNAFKSRPLCKYYDVCLVCVCLIRRMTSVHIHISIILHVRFIRTLLRS